jgi:hypothetical protein
MDLTVKKPGTGIPISHLKDVVNRTLKRPVTANTLLSEDDLEEVTQPVAEKPPSREVVKPIHLSKRSCERIRGSAGKVVRLRLSPLFQRGNLRRVTTRH